MQVQKRLEELDELVYNDRKAKGGVSVRSQCEPASSLGLGPGWDVLLNQKDDSNSPGVSRDPSAIDVSHGFAPLDGLSCSTPPSESVGRTRSRIGGDDDSKEP
mmetsp:Transcript_11548/g.18494  ORF Transcript_11548/g.18494 Transcript_11548/m.18494 type:complete len:103 (+) Transcript_11548:162-470(+)